MDLEDADELEADIDKEEITTFANSKNLGFIATLPREINIQRGFTIKISLDRNEVVYCRLGLSFVPAVPEKGHENWTDSVGLIRIWETITKEADIFVKSALEIPPGVYKLQIELARGNRNYPGRMAKSATKVTATRAVFVMEGSKL